MAEHLPGAIQVFSRALGVNEAELFKMMERGELMAADVLPKVASEFRRTAREGGAYTEALKALRVQKGKFLTESQRAADTIFKSGFEEGLSELYGELSSQLKTTGKSQEDLGNIYNKFFKMLKVAIKGLTPIIEALIQVVSKGVDILELSAKGWVMLYEALKDFSPLARDVAVGIGMISLAFTTLAGKLLFVLGLFQEVASLFDDKLVGKLEASLGYQVNLKEGTRTGLRQDEKGQFFSTGKTSKLSLGDLLSDIGKDSTSTLLVGGGLIATLMGVNKVFKTMTAVVSGASKAIGSLFGLRTPDITKDIGKKTKTSGKGSKTIIPPFLLNPATITAAALTAPVVTKAMHTAQNYESEIARMQVESQNGGTNAFSRVMSLRRGMSAVNEGFQLPMSPLMTPSAMPQQVTNPSVIFEGMDIQINVSDGNPAEMEQAADMFTDRLRSNLESLVSVKRGR